MAGIWDRWLDAENKAFNSFAIITTHANEAMAPIHRRMPVILTKAAETAWVDHQTPFDALSGLLKPFEGSMESYEISTAVNNPGNNSELLLLQVGTKS